MEQQTIKPVPLPNEPENKYGNTPVKHPYNNNEFSKNYEFNDQPSQTIPDGTMTLRELLDRSGRGLPVDGSKVPIFDTDEEYNDIPDPRTLDLSERAEYAEYAKQQIAHIKEKHNKGQKSSAKLVLPDVLAQGNDGTEAAENPQNEG